jgi:trehalose 6-phosphate synthase
MGGRRKLIVVSNRGPITYARGADGERLARRGGGGLVTALRSLVSHHDVTWIASAMSDEDRAVSVEAGGAAIDERSRDGSPFRLRLVAHDETAYDWFYNVVSNPMLWFLQHYLWELAYEPSIDVALQHAWDGGYATVNETFAEAVLEELELEPEAAVFFHDYHLYLAPRLVRERAPDALLAHFVHIPWPQTDYWHVLPDRIRRAIHDGVLANDVVGFHTRQWCLNFMRAATSPATTAARSRRCTRSPSTPPSSTSSPRATPCWVPSAIWSTGGPRSSSCASIGPIPRRTSFVASVRSSSISRRTRRCTAE